MSTFFVTAKLAHPQNSERHLDLELLVDTGATWTLLPTDVVEALGLLPSRERGVTLANGERVTYRSGEVVITLNDEDLTTLYLAGPPGCLPLLGAVTLEQGGLAPDPIRRILISVGGLLASAIRAVGNMSEPAALIAAHSTAQD